MMHKYTQFIELLFSDTWLFQFFLTDKLVFEYLKWRTYALKVVYDKI